jgi:hypothetical protein
MPSDVASALMTSDFGLSLLGSEYQAVPPVITPFSVDQLDDPVSAAPYANPDEQKLALIQLYSDTQASAAQSLRYQAAQELGIYSVTSGSVSDYRNLTADEQIALTDRMAQLIVNNPGFWTSQVVDAAQARVANPYYNTPLANTGYASNLIDRIADGSFISDALGGGQQYIKWMFVLAIAFGILYLLTSNRQPQLATT